MKKITVGLLL